MFEVLLNPLTEEERKERKLMKQTSIVADEEGSGSGQMIGPGALSTSNTFS